MTAAGPSDAGGSESERFWEDLYRRGGGHGGARPNAVLVDVAEPLSPGTALDLGCGAGGDALWLAGRGWRVTAVDVSATAVARVAENAAAAGVGDRVEIQRHDLSATFPQGQFDLVCALYLQSPVDFDRERVLRTAAGAVTPGGLLLVVDHASVAPWSWNQDHDARFPTPEEALAALDLDIAAWVIEQLDAPQREANGPDGQTATVTDTVIALRRSAP